MTSLGFVKYLETVYCPKNGELSVFSTSDKSQSLKCGPFVHQAPEEEGVMLHA